MAPENLNTSTSTPQQSADIKPQNSELYRQISREDEVRPEEKKKQRPLVVTILAGLMRLTLYLDSLRRSNELLFRKLNIFWGILMSILYLSGILMICFSLYNRLQLPLYLEDQLKARGIQFESADYDMDRIEVHQLKGPNGQYTVDTLIAYTTFTDLLQKRIRSVILDGLTINLDEGSDFNPVQDIPEFLSRLQQPVRGNFNLKINAITINNAKLNLQAGTMSLPLSFSMESIYDDTTQIIIPVLLDQPALKFKGTLTMAGTKKKPVWSLKISKGNVTLPRRAPEDFTGEININLIDKKLDTIKAEFTLGTGTIKKQLQADLKQKDEQGFSGIISWERKNETEPTLSSDLTFSIDYLSLNETLATKGILTIDSKQFNMYDVSFKNLHLPLDAEILCNAQQRCVLDLLKDAQISLSDFQFNYQHQNFKATQPLKFTLNAWQQLIIADAQHSDLVVEFNLPIQDLVFLGQNQETGDNLNLSSQKISLNTILADEPRIGFSANNLAYQSPEITFSQAVLNITDLLQSTAKITMQARDVHLIGQPVLSYPFDIGLNMVGNQVAAKLKFKNQPITANLEGRFSLDQQFFAGQVNIPPFDLQKISVPLHDLWPAVPETVDNPSGQLAIKGRFNWQKGLMTGNPLYVGFQNVSFDIGDVKIEGLNTVLTVDSLSPLTTASNQHLFIKNIEALIPIQGLDAQFQMDNQSLKVNQLLATSASVPLVLPPSIITPQSNGFVLTLKNNRPINLQQLQPSTFLTDVIIQGGTASVTVPVEFKNNLVHIPDVTLKIQDLQLKRKNGSYPNIFGTQTGFISRTGLVVLDQTGFVHGSLNGNLLPSKTEKEIQLDRVPLPDSFMKKLPSRQIPKDILERQKALFEEKSDTSQ